MLWEWINQLLTSLGEPPVTRRLSLSTAFALGAVCETLWRVLPVTTEPPMTRFIAAELAKDHWFNLAAARLAAQRFQRKRDLLGTARARALENHVFEQMRHTHLFRTLMQRCGADPCPESN